MASFMDYYNEELAKRGSAPKQSASKAPVKTIQELNGASGADEGIFDPRNPIGWALDILSRPLYGVQNVVEDKLKTAGAAARKAAGGDPVGGFADALGDSLFKAPGPQFLEGLFSNEKKDKITTSKNIELAVDEANSTNPGYENTEDNVNPITKGVLGFIGDVGLDPLTYVPGAAIAAAGGKIGSVVKGAKGAVEGAVKGAKGEKAVEEAVEAAAPLEVPVAAQTRQADENPFEDATTPIAMPPTGVAQPGRPPISTQPASVPRSTAEVDELTQEIIDRNQGKSTMLMTPDDARVFDDVTPDVPTPKVGPQGKKSPASPKTGAGIVTPPSVVAAPEVVEVLAGTKSLSQAIKDSPRVAGLRAEIKSLFDDVKNSNPATAKQPTTFKDWLVGGGSKQTTYVNLPGDGQVRSYTMGELAKIASIKDPALAQRAQAARKAVQEAYAEAQTVKATAVTDAVQAFQVRLQNGEKQLRAALGEDLVDLLKGVTSPVTMTRTLNQLDRILSGKVDVEAFGARNSASKRLLDTISRSLGDGTSPSLPSLPGQPQQQAAVLSETSEVFRQTVRQEMLPGTPEFNAKYAEFAKGNPVTFTEKDLDTRLGRWWRKANSHFQYTLYAKLWEDVLKNRIVQQTGSELAELKGRVNAVAVRDAINSMGDDITRSLDTFGVPLHIGVDDRLVKLTFPQVYKALDDILAAGVSDDAALLALHNGGTRVAFTRLMEAVHLSITDPAVGADDLAALLRSPLKSGARGGKPGGELPNNITANGKGWYAPVKNLTPKMQEMAAALGGKWVKGPKQGYQLTFTKGGNLPELLAEAIVRAREPLSQLAAKNAEDWAARGVAEAADISGQALARLRRLANDPSKAAQRELAQIVKLQPKTVAEDAAAIAATPEGTQAAEVAARAAVGERAVKDAEAIETQNADVHAGIDPKEAADKRVDKQMAAIVDEDAELGNWREMVSDIGQQFAREEQIIATPFPKTPQLDLADKEIAHVYELREGLLGGLARSLGTRFQWNHQTPTMGYEAQGIGVTASRFVTDGILDPARKLAQAHSPETLVQAFKAVQQGTKLPSGSELAQAAQGLEQIVAKLFDLENTKVSALGNVFTDTAVNINHVNEMLRWAMGPRALEFDMEGARTVAKSALGPKATKAQINERVAHELKEQWRGWSIGDDVPGALAAMGQAAARVAEQRAIAASFTRVGQKNGWIVQSKDGSGVPADFVKLVDSGGSTFARLLPKNTYMQRDLAKELHVLDYLATVSRQLSGELGDFVRSTATPITNSWKRLMTVMRPGHHIRNGIGNLSIQYVARGTRDFAKSWNTTLKLMGVRNDYEGLDALAALRGMGDESVPSGGDVLVSGRYGDLTQDELWLEMNRQGLFPTYSASEGLLDDEVLKGGLVARAASAVSLENTKIGRLAGGVSQGLDHYQRAHHFLQILMQESAKRGRWNAKSKQELFKLAAREVKRSHPDASMLAPFENKVMKLIIPFYTWLRGIMPFAIESAIQHPGRIMAFPKASYNLAVAMGLNPENLADPFPPDQMFPSFIRESVFGPQFQFGDTYVKVNPGIAHADIAQTFGSDPIRGLLGMTNPLFRVPAELASGGSWQTGGRINDTSDYLDQSIPGVNYLANLTGISPTGSVESILQGQGLDPQAQVEKGNKTDWDKLITGINWLTGIGVQNLSKPNYINYAEIEKRNAAAKEK